MLIDLSPAMHERVVCSISAAAKYEVAANIVLAVAEQEGGKPGQWVRNNNGTYDVGSMQFNTSFLAELARFNITAADVAASGCYSYDLAAWRLRMHIRKDQGDLWTKAANYHSRTPRYNAVYRSGLITRGAKWAAWLEARFPTYDSAKGVGSTVASVATTAPAAFALAAITASAASGATAAPLATTAVVRAVYVSRTITASSQR